LRFSGGHNSTAINSTSMPDRRREYNRCSRSEPRPEQDQPTSEDGRPLQTRVRRGRHLVPRRQREPDAPSHIALSAQRSSGLGQRNPTVGSLGSGSYGFSSFGLALRDNVACVRFGKLPITTRHAVLGAAYAIRSPAGIVEQSREGFPLRTALETKPTDQHRPPDAITLQVHGGAKLPMGSLQALLTCRHSPPVGVCREGWPDDRKQTDSVRCNSWQATSDQQGNGLGGAAPAFSSTSGSAQRHHHHPSPLCGSA